MFTDPEHTSTGQTDRTGNLTVLGGIVLVFGCLAPWSNVSAQQAAESEQRDWIPYTDSRSIRVEGRSGKRRPLNKDEILALATSQSSQDQSIVVISYFDDTDDKEVYLIAQKLKEEGAKISMWIRAAHDPENEIFVLLHKGDAWTDERGFATGTELRQLVRYIRDKHGE
ncbi:MAG: hypothetical protein AAGH76_06140 [Pseudomonadota bacterium]